MLAHDRPGIIDLFAVHFGQVLRTFGVRVSPAEVIEIRRVMAIIGGRDIDSLRSGLRAVSVKYTHESDGFDQAFDIYFLHAYSADDEDKPRPRGVAAALPDDLEWNDDFEGAARMIGADEHTDEIGDLMADDPDARERHGESAHREENDFSVSAGVEKLDVDQDSEAVSGGVTYTVDVDEADSASVGEIVGAATRVQGAKLGLSDAATILAALNRYDARTAYGTDGADDLDDVRRADLERALGAFVDALAARLDAAGVTATSDDASSDVSTDQADIDRACHRLVQRMRGAPRRVVRRADRGLLDIRATMRSSVSTDGVPVRLWRRREHPGPVRLLVVVDVSLSVRPVTGFILRLAQTLHRFGSRCEVVAFVDRPVRVTAALRSATADTALAAVLSADGLDLSATSDYGQMWAGVLGDFGDLITQRTSILVVGDARSNAFDPRIDLFSQMCGRAHRVAWVTPEPSRYWTQRGCALGAYAQTCAGVISARDGAELAVRADELGNALR
ncbi:hypothetical protein GOEFS_007_00040 [Gordonia effusa NBRC 100432]|uniref:VWFA domain-containing protein n=1 Tax=Gordonia effusa NBRC 100432 TaxID=1077974 RepID=H0QUT6_9ACTN|nr:hypothetical protein GOEFS_007_00040 [Gordonia effusa NBRC 100432]